MIGRALLSNTVQPAQTPGRYGAVVARFSVSGARQLLANGSAGKPLALRYETAGGAGRLVADIFALGPPLQSRETLRVNGRDGGGRGEDADTIRTER